MDQQFFEAVKSGDIATVQELLRDNPALASAKNEDGLSAVMLGTYYGQPQVVWLLLEHTPVLSIFEAAAVGDAGRVAALLDDQPELVNATAPDGFAPLGLAAFFGHEQAARVLLDRGAQVNAPSQNAMQVMPLHSAVAGQHLGISTLLLERGADVNAAQQDEFRPIHGAAQNGHVEMIELLLRHGADVGATMQNGTTPLALAEENGHAEAAALLRGR